MKKRFIGLITVMLSLSVHAVVAKDTHQQDAHLTAKKSR
jgi:hypothetical protein